MSDVEKSVPDSDLVLDTKGLVCPEPLMLLHQAVRKVAVEAILLLEATDPSTHRDVVKFCTFLGHELIAFKQEGEVFKFWIKKQV